MLDATHAVHALTEGLASMEVRGGMLDPATAETLWRDGITALLRGFATTPPPGAALPVAAADLRSSAT